MKIGKLKHRLQSLDSVQYDRLTGTSLVVTVASAFAASSEHSLEAPLTVIAGFFAIFSAAIYFIRRSGTSEPEQLQQQGNPFLQENQVEQLLASRNSPLSAYVESLDTNLDFDIETFFVKNYLTRLQQSLPGHINLSLIDPYRKSRNHSFYSGLFDIGYPVMAAQDIQSKLIQTMLRNAISTDPSKYFVVLRGLEDMDEWRVIDMSVGGVEIRIIDGVVSVRPRTQPSRFKKVIDVASQKQGRYDTPRHNYAEHRTRNFRGTVGFWQNFADAENDTESLH